MRNPKAARQQAGTQCGQRTCGVADVPRADVVQAGAPHNARAHDPHGQARPARHSAAQCKLTPHAPGCSRLIKRPAMQRLHKPPGCLPQCQHSVAGALARMACPARPAQAQHGCSLVAVQEQVLCQALGESVVVGEVPQLAVVHGLHGVMDGTGGRLGGAQV